jgi:hypothetical protein
MRIGVAMIRPSREIPGSGRPGQTVNEIRELQCYFAAVGLRLVPREPVQEESTEAGHQFIRHVRGDCPASELAGLPIGVEVGHARPAVSQVPFQVRRRFMAEDVVQIVGQVVQD